MNAKLAAAIGIVSLLVVPMAGAVRPTALNLQFSVPAQASGATQLDGLQWILLTFATSSSAEFLLQLDGSGSTTNRSFTYTSIESSQLVHAPYAHPLPNATASLPVGLSAHITLDDRFDSLFIQADRIQFATTNTTLEFDRSLGELRYIDHLPAERVAYRATRPNLGLAPPGLTFPIASETPEETFAFEIKVEGLQHVEWANADVTCSQSDACPDGAGADLIAQPIPGGHMTTGIISFTQIETATGRLTGTGTALAVASGGLTATMSLDGWARFPEASLSGQCGKTSCNDPDGRTFQAQGHIVLESLIPLDRTRNRVGSQFHADLDIARFDESSADALVRGTWAGATVAGVAGLVGLGKLLAGLFARNTRPILDHPRAKAIHDLVHATPGISFTQIKQVTGLAHGNVHYHVRRLLKAGLIVAYAYSKSVHYYENHGRHRHDWKEHAALRKPELQRLHEWIAEHPRAKQVGVIEAASGWGWKRVTIQRRLTRLLDAGLITERRASTFVEYVAVHPQDARAGAPAGAPRTASHLEPPGGPANL